jgi:hypothetical protein
MTSLVLGTWREDAKTLQEKRGSRGSGITFAEHQSSMVRLLTVIGIHRSKGS